MADLYLVSWVDSSFDDWLLEGSDYEHDGEVIKLSNETGICRFGEWVLPTGQFVFIRYKGEGSLILQDKDGNEETTALSSSNWTNSLVSFTSDKIFYVIRLKSASGSDLEVDFIGFTSAKLLGNVVLRADWSERKEIVSSDSLGATQLTQSIASRRELRIETRMLRDEWKKFDLAFAKYSHLVLIKPSSFGGVGIATLDSSGADWVVPFQLLRYDTDLIAPHTTRTRITGSTILQDPMLIDRFGISEGLSFDGENDYVDVSDDPSLDLTDAFTIECLIKHKREISQWERIIDKRWDEGYVACLNAGTSNTENSYLPVKGSFCITLGDGSTYLRLGGQTVIENQMKWFHCVGVWTGTNPPSGFQGYTAYIFINGIEETSLTYETNPCANDDPLTVGMNRTTYVNNEKLKADLGFVRIYNRALSEDEIKFNLRNPTNPIRFGLVLWLGNRMTAETWYDLSGEENHGTIYGATPVKVIP